MNATAILALRHYFETLTPDSLSRLSDYYAHEANFKDPFNEVRGITAVEGVFHHMFEQLVAPVFVIQESWANDRSAVLLWEFKFFFRGKEPVTQQRFTGMSLLRFDSNDKITDHRDYWDAAEEIYEKFPLIGPSLRWIERRMK